MRHRFMDAAAMALAARGIATFRYQFPYAEKRKGSPDPQPVLLATVRSAIEAARAAAPGLPLFAGGKSMGGRMTSLAAAAEPLGGVRGLVFYGFPLHAPAKRGVERAEHLADVRIPLLFLQGTRDTLADLDLLRPVIERLGSGASLHVVEDGDHSFGVPRRSGRTAAEVIEDLSNVVAEWIARHQEAR
jgi:predicted alpha/beta-hydrolase family hydrolase